ncbi:hypothetical protein DY000_02020407 [Brassica cretica]|uniref:Uncharacterized protein n=1 Tax=Brassica cretica TaxID=69181 RepID=A0ABQ7E214_BRACR|nr:hypothetical protein DY000_02020407 [Brassica cretica]
MSSSHGDKGSSDVEMGEATSPAPIPTSPVEAAACVADHLSFREKLVHRQAEKEQVRAGVELPSSSALAVAPGHGTEGVTPRDTGTLAGSVIPDASALPAGSSTTPILVEDKERAADSMPPPPARKEIVLTLRAPSSVFPQPRVVVCGLEDDVAGASIIIYQCPFYQAVRYSERYDQGVVMRGENFFLLLGREAYFIRA